MTAKVLAKARVREAAPTQEEGTDKRNETARQDGGGLGVSQHATAVQGGKPEKRQLLPQQAKRKPKLQLRQQPEQQQQHEPRPKPTLAPARRWGTFQHRTQSQRAPAGPGPTPTSGSSMAERRLILWRDEGVPLPNKMDQEIASAIHRALFHQTTPAHIQIMNKTRNAKGAKTAVTHEKTPAAMALAYRELIINSARTVDRGVIDGEANECWERLNVHAVPLVRYMGKGTEGLQNMRYNIHAEIKGVVIPVPVQRLANVHSIRGRRQRGADLRNVSGLCGKGRQGDAKTGQRRNHSGASVVPSRTIHECRPRQQMCALLRMGPHREQMQWQPDMRLLL